MANDVQISPDAERQRRGKVLYRLLFILIAVVALIVSALLLDLPRRFLGDVFGSAALSSGGGASASVYYDLPEASVTLVAESTFTVVNLTITLELERADQLQAVEGFLPQYTDATYLLLSGLTRDDLRGTAALSYLRQELLFRFRKISPSLPIQQVLFTGINIQ
ncbi:MAG: flagellar basal body-associated FliL family protein [Alphaproteobacteria bacterium]|nr:flagellar basal body-associated FliL family protein [Alphaproteobacteria bacterium]